MELMIAILATAFTALLAFGIKRQHYALNAGEAHRIHLAQENAALRGELRELHAMLTSCGGGVDKRISEHAEVVATINALAPQLYEQEPGLKYMLSANLQFFRSVRNFTISTGIMRLSRGVKIGTMK